MIRPLRRLHRRMIALVIVTLACAFVVLLVSAFLAVDVRVDALPASPRSTP